MSEHYQLSAVLGKMAGNIYYTCMINYELVGEIFEYAIEELIPENRSQRLLNMERIPKIVNYVEQNPTTYVFPSITISVGNCLVFEPIIQSMGILKIPKNTRIVINDGQHRIASIKRLIQLDEKYKKEELSVVIFQDEGLSRSQQIFTDLNKYAYRVSNSISTLYDNRDELSQFTVRLVDEVAFFSRFVDKERDCLGKNSGKIFTLNYLKQSVAMMMQNVTDEGSKRYTIQYWQELSMYVSPWNELFNSRVHKNFFRENYVAGFSIVLKAFGKLGSYFLENKINFSKLDFLSEIDWSRSNQDWVDMILNNKGKVITSDMAATKLYEYLKNQMVNREVI